MATKSRPISYKSYLGSPTGRFGAPGRNKNDPLAAYGGHMDLEMGLNIVVLDISLYSFSVSFCIQLRMEFVIVSKDFNDLGVAVLILLHAFVCRFSIP